MLPTTDAAPSAIPERPINIAIFGGAQAVSQIGNWMQTATIGWLSWSMTHSPAWVGAIAVTQLVAAIVVGPLAGTFVDRNSPYRVITTTQSLLAVHATALCLISTAGLLTIWPLLGLAMAGAIINAVNLPVQTKVIAFIAGRERMSQAVATNSVAFNLARSIGPAIAGIFLLHDQASLVFGLNAGSYLVFLIAMAYLKPWTDRRPAGKVRHFFADVAAGFRYVVGKRDIAMVFLLAVTFASLARPFLELLPAFAGEVFHGGPEVLTTLMSAQGVGSLFGAVWMLRKRGGSRLARNTFAGGIAMPIVLVAFCATPHLRVAIGCIAVIGAAHVVCNVGMQSMAQTFSDDEYKGRVMALYGLVFRSVPSLGAFLIGLVAHQLGLRVLVGTGAAIAALLIVRLSLRARRMFAEEPS